MEIISDTFESESDLLDVNELMTLLGCKDKRTVEKWCKANNLSFLKLGKRKFVSATAVHVLINEKLARKNINPANTVFKVINSPSSFKSQEKHSRAALNYMKKFKAA